MDKAPRDFSDNVRKIFKSWAKRHIPNKRDRLSRPLWAESRVRYDDMESWREYGIIPAHVVDGIEDVDQWAWDTMACYVTSPYDCSGQAFTRFIDTHRNPDGTVSYVHHMSLDL